MPDGMIVYVDGFNLYNGMHDKYGHRFLWLDLPALAQSLRPRSNLVQLKYFTAPVLDQPAAQSRQDTYLDALHAQHGDLVQVILGRYQRKQRKCRTCGSEWAVYEEKETDVNIAVELVADAAARAADSFMIVSADSDVVPAVKMARRLNPGAFFMAAFPPKRYSAEIERLMPASLHIGRSKLAQSLLPQTVPGLRGLTHTRPSKWQ